MGLAASQARFLAITSRKARCEFESMSIAQDKLSVTRDLEKISKDYQQALNQTSLAWDFDGSGENLLDLTYGLLMTPTAVNNFNPCLITDRASRVVLNDPMAKAAEAVCPGGQPSARSAGGFSDFLEALYNNGVIPSLEKEGMKKYAVTLGKYDPLIGYGAEPLNKNGIETNNIYGLAKRIEDALIDKGLISEKDKNIFGLFTNCDVYVNGAKISSQLKVSDLLTKDVVIMSIGGDGDHSSSNMKNLLGSYGAGWVKSHILSNWEGVLKDILDSTGISYEAVYADSIGDGYDNGVPSNPTATGKKVSEEDVRKKLLELANEHNDMVFFKNDGNNFNSGVALNVSNMIGHFLTTYETEVNGYFGGYFAGDYMSTSRFVTDDQDYQYLLKDPDAIDNETVMKADFYMQIYNNICINGWTENPDIDSDPEYLEQMLKSGHYFITSLNLDGYFYQNRYNELETILEIKDSDAIARAEAEYTSKKAKLTYKEDQLDLDMKNLDAEISALTTEYDTVKNLISKNVEKVFQMFQ